jgi:hypothetical protein
MMCGGNNGAQYGFTAKELLRPTLDCVWPPLGSTLGECNAEPGMRLIDLGHISCGVHTGSGEEKDRRPNFQTSAML